MRSPIGIGIVEPKACVAKEQAGSKECIAPVNAQATVDHLSDTAASGYNPFESNEAAAIVTEKAESTDCTQSCLEMLRQLIRSAAHKHS